MRWALALGVLAVAFAAAVYVRQMTFSAVPAGWTCYTPGCPVKHEAWQSPVAILLAIGGLAAAAGIIAVRRGRRLVEP
jgi:hypothetical protein